MLLTSGSRRRKRTVILGPGFAEKGGAQRRLRLLGQGLSERGWDVKVVGRAGTFTRPKTIRCASIRGIDIPGWNRRWGALVYVLVGLPLTMWWSIRCRLLIAMQLGSQTLVAALASLLMGKGFVTLLTSSGQFGEAAILRGRNGAVRRWALRRARLLIVQTEAAMEDVRPFVPIERVRVLANPLAIPTDPPALTGQPNVLFSGRFSAEKDMLSLLKAWRRVLLDLPEARLILLGAGGHYRSVEPEVRELISADPHLEASVQLPGWVMQPDEYLSACDVAVIPSLSEGMSNSLLEAYAMGRVIVASDIPSNIAVLGVDHPLLFPPGDSEALYRAIMVALGDENIRCQVRHAALEGRWRFEKRQVTEQFEEILREAQTAPRHQHS